MNRGSPNGRNPNYRGGRNPQNMRNSRTAPNQRPNRQNPRNGQNRRADLRYGSDPRANRPRISPEEQARREAYAKARREEAERRRRAQIAYEERQKRIRKAERKRRFRENMAIFGGRMLIFGIMLVIMVSICIGTFLVTLHNAPDKPSDSGVVTYYFGGAQVRQAKTKSAVVGDEVYFCFNDLADYLGMSETGSASEMKFIMPVGENAAHTAAGDGTEDSIVFLTDKTSIILNGQLVVMKVPNLLRGTEVWVSSDFVADFMENLSLTYDERKREMRIARVIDEALSTEEEPVYLTPVFTLKRMNAIEPIPEDPLVGDVSFSADSADGAVSDVLSFKADVSAYEAYMNPEGDMRDAFLVLANSENPLGAEHSLSGFYEVANVSVITPTQYLEEYAAKALEAMFKEMKANEFYSMAVYAGYRSYYEQSDLFEAQVAALQSANASLSRSQAEENASMHVSRPGCDDHQTGLAVDMDTWGCVDTNFQFEAEYKWLSENAWKFGFILRYPRDKTDETDHAFEPWHYRYVGRYHAQKIHATGLCLEEYLERIR